MPIVRYDTFVERYGLRGEQIQAGTEDLAVLSGRSDSSITAFRNQEITNHLAVTGEEVVLDVGCGDGSLLEMLAPQIQQGFGTAPTDAEVQALTHAHSNPHLAFRQALVQELPFEAEVFDRIICNGVIQHLDSRGTAQQALRELARVAKRGARVFTGEIPTTDEYVEQTMRSKSLLGWLAWRWRVQGKRAFLQGAFDLARATFTSEPFIVITQTHFYCAPSEWIEMARESGLHCETWFSSKTLNRAGQVEPSKTRFDFLLVKR
ncbi:MAG TPA: class I SAM-dependent methyltransferase [Anaerolineae bacterium]|nr:class I SAM-dependent methyltransferase [Anaerolineae bacterium]